MIHTLEPEHLVDVTEAASAVTATGICVEIPFIQRFGVHKATEAMASGTIINAAFDLLLGQHNLSDDEALQTAEAGSRLSLASLAFKGLDLDSFRASIRPKIALLRDAILSFENRDVEVESVYLSPELGLQGRVDILLTNPLEVVEMKSGRPHISHQAQLAGYVLLMNSQRSSSRPLSEPLTSESLSSESLSSEPLSSEPLIEKGVCARLWYVGQESNTWVALGDVEGLQTRLMEARNSIVQTELDLCQRKFGVLKAIGPHIDGLATFQRAEAADFAAAYTSLDPIERTAFQAWVSFLARESVEQRVGATSGRALAELWRTDLAAKRASTSVLTDLHLDSEASDLSSMHLTLRVTPSHRDQGPVSTSSDGKSTLRGGVALRAGDPIFLYPQHPTRRPCDGPLFKGSVISVSADRVDVTLRNKHARLPNADKWVVEQDASDSFTRRTYGCLAMWMRAAREKRQMLLGLRRPTFADSVHSGSIAKSDANHSGNIITRAISARDFFLVQGPPGTGKTSMILRTIVTDLLKRPDERLLILAYTNRAADEICSVLQRYVGEGVLLRHGSRAGARGDDSVASLLAQNTPSDSARILSDCKCIVSTVSSAINQPDIFSFGAFTTAIVDEASQVLEPMLAGLLAQTGRFILIGDVCQLPAVVSQPVDGLAVQAPMLRDICMTSLGMSMFERLYRVCVKNGWHDAYAHLTRQGRMHQDVQAFPSHAFYGGRLEPLAEWQTSTQPWISTSDALLTRVLYTRATFLQVEHADQQLSEAILATQLAKQILRDAHALGIEASIGIITPFRAQNNLVLQLLHDSGTSDDVRRDENGITTDAIRRHISVDTVERFQGSERDVIIYAVSAASMADMTGIASEITLADGAVVDRKLNVALTRAKQHIVVIGNPRFLRMSASYAKLIDHLALVTP